MKEVLLSVVTFFQWLFLINPAPIIPPTKPIVITPTPSTHTVTTTPSPTDAPAIPTRKAATPFPVGYELDYPTIKALLSLEDQIPPMPPDGFENGLEIHFRERETPQSIYIYQKMLVEDHAFLCGLADQSNWREYGSHNSYVERKYGVDPMKDNISSYHNLLIQNPGGLYTSQRNDLLKVSKHYCGDRVNTQLGIK